MDLKTAFMVLAFAFCMVSCIVALSLLIENMRGSIRKIQNSIADVWYKIREIDVRIEDIEKGGKRRANHD